MKALIPILLFFCSHSAFGQWCNKPNPDFCPGNFFQNGDFEKVSGDPDLQGHQDIHLADGWKPMWGSGSLADLFCFGGSTTSVAPTPNTNDYAGMWIQNVKNDYNDATYREGMYNRLAKKIDQNSGTYSFSFKMANAIVGNTNPANPVRIGIYGVYNPSDKIADAPTGLNFNPTNENLWLSKDPTVKVVKLRYVDSPNPFSNTWVSQTVTFDSQLLPATGITHIMITSDDLYRPNNFSKLYINFDEFCLQKTKESRFCCPGTNLVENGDFEATGSTSMSPTVQYTYNPTVALGATLPGEYNIINASDAATISPTWLAQDHGTCPTTPSLGKFLAVNGKTGQISGGWITIWEQTITVVPNKDYHFCAYMKNLPQCGFDVKPVILVDVNYSLTYQPTTISPPSGLCSWQLVSFNFTPTTTSATITIKLRDTQPGDGNDLAIDDISLTELPIHTPNLATFQFQTQDTNPNDLFFQITATPDNPLSGCEYAWFIYSDPPDPNIFLGGAMGGGPLLVASGGASNWAFSSTNFPGYCCTVNGTVPGNFAYNKSYYLNLIVQCDCSQTMIQTYIVKKPSRKAALVVKKQADTNLSDPKLAEFKRNITTLIKPSHK